MFFDRTHINSRRGQDRNGVQGAETASGQADGAEFGVSEDLNSPSDLDCIPLKHRQPSAVFTLSGCPPI